jgi:DNA-binding winged helix-turn-helix (wHTH) protein
VLRLDIQQFRPNDTVVEFDQGINAAINRLRTALGDSAEAPRYIETLARRGYRFIGRENDQNEAGEQQTESGHRPRYAGRAHQRGAIPLEDALAIARQIADALEAAHEKGMST